MHDLTPLTISNWDFGFLVFFQIMKAIIGIIAIYTLVRINQYINLKLHLYKIKKERDKSADSDIDNANL